jgi:hypothetical protein
VVLDSEADLRRVVALLPGARVLIRVNPDLPVATHPHLATGKGESQFGVLPEAVPRLMGLAQALGLRFLGLHLHLGSKLERVEDFLEGYQVLEGLYRAVGPVEVLDLGGGFGLGLPLSPLREPMEALARLYGAKVYLEPGRYLVAEAGVLVARIWGIKETRRRYLLLDAGMTSLLRPALYGARHPVVPPLRGRGGGGLRPGGARLRIRGRAGPGGAASQAQGRGCLGHPRGRGLRVQHGPHLPGYPKAPGAPLDGGGVGSPQAQGVLGKTFGRGRVGVSSFPAIGWPPSFPTPRKAPPGFC